MSDPREIATRRYELIAPLLDKSLSPGERRGYMRALTSKEIEWPLTAAERARGAEPQKRPVSRSTIYAWIKRYLESGFEGLIPALRSDRGASRYDVEAQVNYALGLLYENPERSFTQLIKYLEIEFGDSDSPGGDVHIISRSTLSRRLRDHAAFTGIQKLRGDIKGKQRGSFQADRAHQGWQLDGKGPFTVRFTDGTELRCHVLSVLECYSRVILGSIVCLAENVAGTILVFLEAVRRYGLPDRFQFDQGSAFNSVAFRSAIADLGVHRNYAAVKTPELQGLIEAFHRVLIRWFIKELPDQEVHDLAHLQELLTAMIEEFYNKHHHRIIGMKPVEKLAGRISPRRLDEETLQRSFWFEEQGTVHRKTGEVKLSMGTYRVPAAYAGGHRPFRCYPVPNNRVALITPDGREIDLEPFVVKSLPPPRYTDRAATGQLQKLLDVHRGHSRPLAQPGFGLPEIFKELGKLMGRTVPMSTAEATAIRAFYREYGPLPREPFLGALKRTAAALGPQRPLQSYLDHLERQIRAAAGAASDTSDASDASDTSDTSDTSDASDASDTSDTQEDLP